MKTTNNKILALLISAFILILAQSNSFAEIHYVTQDGSGTQTGRDLSNSWSVSDFNNSDNWSTNDATDNLIGPNDTVYFSGELTSRVRPAGSGSTDKYITLDGYEPGDNINVVGGDNTSGFAYWDGADSPINLSSRDWIRVRDFRITNWSGSYYGAAIVGTNCHYLHIINNHIHDGAATCKRGIAIFAPSSGRNADILVEGNFIYNVPDNSSIGLGVVFVKTDRAVVKGNYFGACVDNVQFSYNNNSCLVENNSFTSKAEVRPEDHIDIKNMNTDIIIRYNKFYETKFRGYSAIQVQRGTKDVYIYCNDFYNSPQGVYMYGGSTGGTYHGQVERVHIWGNVFREGHAGVRSLQSDAGTIGAFYVYNNTFFGHSSTSSTQMTAFSPRNGEPTARNNLFYNNTTKYGYLYQMYIPSWQVGNTKSENNLGFNDEGTALVYWDTEAINFESHGSNNIRSNPELTSYMQPTSASTPVIDAGMAISDSILPDYDNRLIVDGKSWCNNVGGTCDELLSYSIILDPATDWTSDPPNVMTGLQSDYGSGWEIGAYVYYENDISAPTTLIDSVPVFTKVNLSWEDNSYNEEGFIIQRSETGANYINIDTVDANITSFQDTGLVPSSVEYYRVFAYNDLAQSFYSNYVSVFLGIVAPANLSPASISFTWIDLSWEDNSKNEDGFIIQRKESGTDFVNIDTVSTNITNYKDTGLDETITYYYRIFAYNDEGISEYSNSISVKPGINSPSDLYVTSLSTTWINLSWVDNSDNEDGFIIQRSENGTDYVNIDTVNQDITAFMDDGLATATTYYYRVLAYNDEGMSDYSNVVSEETYSGNVEIDDPVFKWNFEEANILLDEGTAQKDLTDNGNVTTGGTEPDPPGYGSVGAVFNGNDQYLTLSNSDYGDRALNGTDTDGTIYIAIRPDVLETTDYLWNIYKAASGERQIALTLENGIPYFLWGYNNGDSYQIIKIPYTFSAQEDIIIGLSLDAAAKTYTFLGLDVLEKTYYSCTESETSLEGTYNTGSSQMSIACRSDEQAARAFEGTVYWVRIYDEAHSEETMKAVMEGTITGISKVQTPNSGLLKSYPNPFSNQTTISYTVTTPSTVSLSIYNVSGQFIKTLVNRKMNTGSYEFLWDGCNESGSKLSGGIYYCRMAIGNSLIINKKMVLLE